MTARPSHMAQQKVIDDTIVSMPSSRWRWLFTPEPAWLNTINTTNLRTVNAIRMFIGVEIIWAVMTVGVTGYALTRCGILIQMFGYKVFQLLPPPGKLGVADWRLCEESLATARMLDFVSELFNGNALLLAGMAGFALGAMAVKRLTDTEHKVKVAEATKAPIILPVTGEHAAQPPVPQVVQNVNVGEVAEPEPKPEEHEWADGDPRGGVL